MFLIWGKILCIVYYFLLLPVQKFVDPLKHQSILAHEDYSAVFSHILVSPTTFSLTELSLLCASIYCFAVRLT